MGHSMADAGREPVRERMRPNCLAQVGDSGCAWCPRPAGRRPGGPRRERWPARPRSARGPPRARWPAAAASASPPPPAPARTSVCRARPRWNSAAPCASGVTRGTSSSAVSAMASRRSSMSGSSASTSIASARAAPVGYDEPPVAGPLHPLVEREVHICAVHVGVVDVPAVDEHQRVHAARCLLVHPHRDRAAPAVADQGDPAGPREHRPTARPGRRAARRRTPPAEAAG